MIASPLTVIRTRGPKTPTGKQRFDSDVNISIIRIVRAMRGGSQSRLVQCDDGQLWVAKFLGNPQGNRTLINELIAYRFMLALRISTPELHLLHLPAAVRESQPIAFLTGDRIRVPEGDLHLGSRCPVNPETTAIFDFLPAKYLPSIINIEEFASMFVLDKLLHNVDKRQAIFFRETKLHTKVAFRAQFIDHGSILGAHRWELGDVQGYGLFVQRGIYSLIDMGSLTEAVIEQIDELADVVLDTVIEGIPSAWFASGDHARLMSLLSQIKARRTNLGSLIHRHLSELTCS